MFFILPITHAAAIVPHTDNTIILVIVARPLRTRLFVHVPVVRSPLLMIEMDIMRPQIARGSFVFSKGAACQSHTPVCRHLLLLVHAFVTIVHP